MTYPCSLETTELRKYLSGFRGSVLKSKKVHPYLLSIDLLTEYPVIPRTEQVLSGIRLQAKEIRNVYAPYSLSLIPRIIPNLSGIRLLGDRYSRGDRPAVSAGAVYARCALLWLRR